MSTLEISCSTDAEFTARLGDEVCRLPPVSSQPSFTGAHALSVTNMMQASGFAGELTERDRRRARDYVAALWTWCTTGFIAREIDDLLQADLPVIRIRGGKLAQSFAWELMNTQTENGTVWIGLHASIERVPSSYPAWHESGCSSPPDGDICGELGTVLVVTARPYADDDVPAGIPIQPVAAALRLAGLTLPEWSPAATIESLHAMPQSSRRRLLHLDMHGARLRPRSRPDATSVPHLILESARGPDPHTVGEVLAVIPDPPPAALLVTSCEADAADLPFDVSLQGEALAAGVDTVVAARRRLTPDEVAAFSAGFHQAIAEGKTAEAAAVTGRNALHQAVLHSDNPARIGMFAWASFTVYTTSYGARARFRSTAGKGKPLRNPVLALPRALTLPLNETPVVVIQLGDSEDYALSRHRFNWWSDRLVSRPTVSDAPPSRTLAEAAVTAADAPQADGCLPVITMHDWTGITAPEHVLAQLQQRGFPSRAFVEVAPERFGTPTINIVVVKCSPEFILAGPAHRGVLTAQPDISEWLTSQTSHPAQETVLDMLISIVEQNGHLAADLLIGLESYSTGFFWIDSGPEPAAVAPYKALKCFSEVARLAGVARRESTGTLRLDVFHPQLAQAIRTKIEAAGDLHAGKRYSCWLGWADRVALCAPELAWLQTPLPQADTLRDRLLWPSRAIGATLDLVTLQNYLFFAKIQRACLRRFTPWWNGLLSHQTSQHKEQLVELGHAADWNQIVPGQDTHELSGEESAESVLSSGAGEFLTPDVLAEQIVQGAFSSALADLDIVQFELVRYPDEHKPDGLMMFVDPLNAGEPLPADVADIIEQIPWIEDRGRLYVKASYIAQARGGGDAEELLAKGIQYLTATHSPSAIGQAIAAIHVRLARHRLAGDWGRWEKDLNLAVALCRGYHWSAAAEPVQELAEEVVRGEPSQILKFMTQLTRAYHGSLANCRG